MKKIFSLIAIMMLGITAMAQTNFRHISFAEAQKAAQQENKLIFVDFYTSWCGPCKMMANTVFPQQKVGDFMNAKFVCVKYDAEKEELDLVKNSNITAYPTFIIFNADGSELNRKVGGGTAEAFLADIERLSNPDLTPEKVKAEYEAGNHSAMIVKAYAGQLQEEMYNSRRGAAEKKAQIGTIINDYFNSLNDKQKLAKENTFIYENYTDSTADPKMQYLFTNRSKVKKENKADVDSILMKAYKEEMYYYVSFRRDFNKANYDVYCQQAAELGVLDNDEMKAYKTVMDAYATGDMNKYLDAVAESGKNMTTEGAATVQFGLADGLKDADDATKTRAAKYLRSQLADMPANNIMFMAQVISQLEGKNKH